MGGLLLDNQVITVNAAEVNTSLSAYENNLLQFISSFGLPTDNILVPIDERKKVIKNFEDAIICLNQDALGKAIYISKFVTAASSGLFDAALNYLWDETVIQLRSRIAVYDIEYFYDIAVNSDKRKRISGVEDLCKLDDSELINGAKEIDLISEIGYRHLDFIKFMRNWASAAHPNQVEITGLQLITWLETCIKEVINLPNSNITIEIGRLLKNIKDQTLGESDIQTIKSFIYNLSQEKVNSLSSGLFGIYTRTETNASTRNNIKNIMPSIWEMVEENVRNDFGIKYARFSVNGDVEQAQYAREFLQIVDGESYLPDQIKATELDNVISQLLEAHNGTNNFYKEPPYAHQLERLVGTNGVPSQVNDRYVMSLIYVFLSNGYGVCFDADAIYSKLIKLFNQKQIVLGVCSFYNKSISSRLQFAICHTKYRELITVLREKNVSPAVEEMIQLIEAYKAPLYTMKNDTTMKQKVESLMKIVNSEK